MVPASRPILSSHFSADKPDYIVPALIRDVSSASDCYASTMASAWKAIEDLLNLGVSLESAMYLLPNAFPVRFEESADLLNLHHKWVHRLCYTAQEEIWNACRQEVAQVVKIFPEIGSYIFAPCWFRSKSDIRPVCPEGDRFCGVAVWKLPIEEYDRII
jgi:thymidylate synthase ThyX